MFQSVRWVTAVVAVVAVVTTTVAVTLATGGSQGKPVRVRASDRLAVIDKQAGSSKPPLQPFYAPLAEFEDHFVFSRPLNGTPAWSLSYSFGSTLNAMYEIHHGLDFSADIGAPVLAVAEGVVYYAGEDLQRLFGPIPNFYGGVVVIEHTLRDAQGRKLYSLYGHLSEVHSKAAQRVKAGETIGLVGQAGIAEGPHLHFEVRAGNPDDYKAVLNPELWIAPPSSMGVLAGRVVDQNKHLLEGIEIRISSEQVSRVGYTYADSTVNGDPILNENFTLAELPQGQYTLTVQHHSGLQLYSKAVQVRAGQVSWLEITVDTSVVPPAPIEEILPVEPAEPISQKES